ncbi:MAG: universal stress protein [Deltaproteobacteria bacterium]|nr:universal stress protein [Deltaproteobacteria bacterium]
MLTYKNILYCTDYSEDAEMAFVNATQFTEKYGAKLHVLHVLDTQHRYLPTETVENQEGGDAEWTVTTEMLDKVKKKVMERYGPRLGKVTDVSWIIVAGVPFVEILKYARDLSVDLIVMGAAGKSEEEQTSFLSTVANVSQRANCHVMAIRNPEKRYTL